MNVYQAIILILVTFVIIYELVPAAQTKIQHALKGTRKRVKELREFVDDDDYNVLNEFSLCPFTMSEYLTRQDAQTWHKIRDRAQRRQRQGWGSPYTDGPDQLEPLRFWWHRGTLIRRDTNVMSYARRRKRQRLPRRHRRHRRR
jgi:hypothetical protein